MQSPYFGCNTTIYPLGIGSGPLPLQLLSPPLFTLLAHTLQHTTFSEAFLSDVRRLNVPERREGEVRALHPYRLVSDAVCLMLKRIIELSDCELRLYERGWRLRSAWLV